MRSATYRPPSRSAGPATGLPPRGEAPRCGAAPVLYRIAKCMASRVCCLSARACGGLAGRGGAGFTVPWQGVHAASQDQAQAHCAITSASSRIAPGKRVAGKVVGAIPAVAMGSTGTHLSPSIRDEPPPLGIGSRRSVEYISSSCAFVVHCQRTSPVDTR